MQAVTRGGAKWRRSAMLFIPAMLGVGILAVATLQGFLPLNLAVIGQDLKLSTQGDLIAPQGLSVYPSDIRMKDGSQAPIVLAGIPEASIPDGLCLSLVLTFPLIGSNTIRISTGETHVNDMTVSAASLAAGTATLYSKTTDGEIPAGDGSNVESPVILNKDASELAGLSGGQPGTFGLESGGSGTVTRLNAAAKGAVIAGTAKLNLRSIKIGHGSGTENGECY